MTTTTFGKLYVGAIFEFQDPKDYSGRSTIEAERSGRFIKIEGGEFIHQSRAGEGWPSYRLKSGVKVRRVDLDDLEEGGKLAGI